MCFSIQCHHDTITECSRELALHSTVHPRAEDLSEVVRRQPPQTELAAAFKELVDGEVALEGEVAAILDLGDRIKA